MKKVGIMFITLSVIFLFAGSYKKNFYNPSKYEPTNVYVGGDAYNYIINSNYTTGYWTLSSAFLISGSVLISVDKMITENRENNLKETKEDEIHDIKF